MVRESTSMYIGHTTRGIAQPVLFDTHTQIYNNNPPTTLITGAPGSGKDLDINTLIPTPYGFRKMGDLKVGDKVLSRNFSPCRVTYAGEIKERQTYEISFSDNRTIVAGKEHQWVIVHEKFNNEKTDFSNNEKYNEIKKSNLKKHDFFKRQAKNIRNLQRTIPLAIKYNQKEWFTPKELLNELFNTGVYIWQTEDEIENILHKYNALESQAYMDMKSGEFKTGYKNRAYNVFMSLQVKYEELQEISLLSLYNEKVVTTEELIELKKTGLVKIRGLLAQNGIDRYDSGYINDDGISVNNVDLLDILQNDDPLHYGSIKERRIELKGLINKAIDYGLLPLKDENSIYRKGYIISIKDEDNKYTDLLSRIKVLTHSLGATAMYTNEDKKSLLLEGYILNDPEKIDKGYSNEFENTENKWVHIVGIKKLEKRLTRCISVDSYDHVYLAGEGFIPTHNTFFAMTLTCLSAVLGKTTVILDPKGDFLSLHELKGDIGEVAFWALRDPKKAGILDPFYLAKEKGEKLNLIIETVSLFLGGLDGKDLQILSPIIKDTMNEPVPSLMLLKENLEMNNRPEARAIGAQLDLISQLPFANLCFSKNSRKKQKEISIDEGVTVIAMAGLELSPDIGSDTASNKVRLSSAIFFLITDFIRRFMHNSQETTPKTIVIDEAWAVLATNEGSRVIGEIARLARSKNLALVLVTQNVKHLDKIDAENTIASRFAFRTDTEEGKTIIKNMNLPVNEGFESVLTELEQGECLMQDWRKRYSTVQISQYNTRWKEAFETNPMEKMRRKREQEKNKRR